LAPAGDVVVSDRRRATLILVSLVATFVVVRFAMWLSPDRDFNIAGYNIHHLYTGLLLATAAGIPLVLRPGRSRLLDAASLLFGAGLSLALDEVVYLIATDGSNASYLLPVSFWGGVVVVGLGAAWLVAVGWGGRGKGG
jgi:hypothetical protein